jgi:4-alpha-glucanotransferase
MKVFELGFDSRDNNGSDYLPHNLVPHCVTYAGTHDNDTILGWLATAPAEDVAYACDYFGITDRAEGHWTMMKAMWATVSELTVVQAQDLFGLGSESRMNRPSTLGTNWCWRALPGMFTDELAEKLHYNMKIYGRL